LRDFPPLPGVPEIGQVEALVSRVLKSGELGLKEGRKGAGPRRAVLGAEVEEGASPTTAMTHLAIQESLYGKVVDWMEKVSDEQYRR